MDTTTRFDAAEIMFHGQGYQAAVDHIRARVGCRDTAEAIAADIHHRGE
jgi:hypothetical protein